MERYQSFDEFWPFYVAEHSQSATRNFHFIGSALALLLMVAGIIYSLKLLVLVPFVGYGLAWVSHFAIEKNKPATFKYPFWSLIADYKMFLLMCCGRMGAEVKRYAIKST